ncbi:Uncharacterised protein [Mycobacteroides abscessus subsp. abscessus]|nr:Uncharacterised protein [Mycobacteroides abscessus subsp. abscessus]
MGCVIRRVGMAGASFPVSGDARYLLGYITIGGVGVRLLHVPDRGRC